MPLYEWQCESCRSTFEVLAPLSRATRPERCPECGRRASRVMSAAVLGGRAQGPDLGLDDGPGTHGAHGSHGANDFAIPPMARFCGMDDKTAQRLAAYKSGRGNEYDDRQAALQERRKKEGVEAPAAPAKPKKKRRHAGH